MMHCHSISSRKRAVCVCFLVVVVAVATSLVLPSGLPLFAGGLLALRLAAVLVRGLVAVLLLHHLAFGRLLLAPPRAPGESKSGQGAAVSIGLDTEIEKGYIAKSNRLLFRLKFYLMILSF